MVALRLYFGPNNITIPIGTGELLNNFILNDADNAIACIYMAEKTGTIDKLAIPVTAKAGTPPSYKVGITTLDASANPTQTNFFSGTIQSHTFGNALTVEEFSLSTPCPVNAGDIFAVHIFPDSTPPDGSNSHSFGAGHGNTTGPETTNLPGIRRFTTAWANSARTGCTFGYRMTDGIWYGHPMLPVSTSAFDIVNTGYQASSTPNEYGTKFNIPVGLTCIGARICHDPPAAGNTWQVKLYDAASNVLVQTPTIDTDINTGNGYFEVYWTSPYFLAPNTDYRIGIPGVSGSSANFKIINFGSGDYRSGFGQGIYFQKTTRKDSGAWSDDTTKLPLLDLIVSDINFMSIGGFAQ